MNTKTKLARIRSMGGRVTTVAEFLDLTEEDRAYVEMRLALSRKIRETREALGWNQTELAGRVGSEQSRIAKVERADPSVSFDLLIRSLLALGLGPLDIASALMTIESTGSNGRRDSRASKGEAVAGGRASKKKATRKKSRRGR